MKIKTTDLKVGDLLKARIIYAVPIFQRSYSWDKAQVSEMFFDLLSVREKKGRESDYFIGSMVFTPHEEKKKVKILDGQQRIATLLLTIAALRDVLYKHEEIDGASEWIEDFNSTIISWRDTPKREKNPKIELNREDRSFFEKVLLEGILPECTRKSHKRIRDAYMFLKQKLSEGVEGGGQSFVEAVLEAMLNKLLLIKIEVDSDINAHTIFETLNDRGLELSGADLVKNYMFSLTPESKLELIVDRWKEVVDQVGDAHVSTFLRHFWISAHHHVRKDELYKAIKKKVGSNNVQETMEQFSKEAKVYSNLRSPTHEFWGDDGIETMLGELRLLKVQQVYTLLLALYDRFKNELGDFRKILRVLVNFTFRYSTVCNFNPNQLERLYSELSIDVRKNRLARTQIIKRIRKESPNRDVFLSSFEDFEINTNNANLARYILKKINNKLLFSAKRSEVTTNLRKLSLEHIIPQNPDAECTKFLKQKKIYLSDILHKIGNMTILLEKINRELSNKYFPKKRKMYKKSILPLNKELCNYSEFGEEELRERQKRIGRLADEVWTV